MFYRLPRTLVWSDPFAQNYVNIEFLKGHITRRDALQLAQNMVRLQAKPLKQVSMLWSRVHGALFCCRCPMIGSSLSFPLSPAHSPTAWEMSCQTSSTSSAPDILLHVWSRTRKCSKENTRLSLSKNILPLLMMIYFTIVFQDWKFLSLSKCNGCFWEWFARESQWVVWEVQWIAKVKYQCTY